MTTRVRDPIHDSIAVSGPELAVVESRAVQRLRHIKQLGFTDQAFPGATHSRFAHALGAMEMATRMFDHAFPVDRCAISRPVRARFRQLVRLGLLLHDVGHPPASHAGERAMPQRSALGLDFFTPEEQAQQAVHEDFTLRFLLDSSLRRLIEDGFPADVTPEAVAHLISGRLPESADLFRHGGVDWFPALSQMVSGELDADRMDYLQRDAFHAGVTYGRFDQSWLLENLTTHVEGGRACLAMSHRAVFAFEDFLLSRYHMFVSVYYHHIPVGLETMLLRFFTEEPDALRLPADPEAYAEIDDITLWTALRQSKNPWAQRVARRQGFRRILELNAEPAQQVIPTVLDGLTAAGVEHFTSQDQSVLSKYYGSSGTPWTSVEAPPLYVLHERLGQAVPVERYARVYERYAQPTRLVRVYCRPDQADIARRIVEGVAGEISLAGAVFD